MHAILLIGYEILSERSVGCEKEHPFRPGAVILPGQTGRMPGV